MDWTIIRAATREDVSLVDAAWARFVKRHPVRPDALYLNGRLDAMDLTVPDPNGDLSRQLARCWQRNRSRALGVACDGIVGGYVGRHVD